LPDAADARDGGDVFIDGQIAVVVEAVADLRDAGAFHVNSQLEIAEVDAVRAGRPCLDHREGGVVLLEVG